MQSFIHAAPARIAGRPWRPVRVDGVVFSPQRNQRRWVRDRVAAIWHPASRRWVVMQRVQPRRRFPFDNQPCQWQAMGGAACFPSIAAAAAWVQSLPRM
jgi:hypothetical protein